MPLSRRDFVKGSLAAAGVAAVNGLAQARAESNGVFPAHAPLGHGQGINPGRVVWAHDPRSVNWDGMDYWWKPANFGAKRILAMLNNGLSKLSGAPTPQAAWQAIFEWHNGKRGRSGGYQPGQKIVIKPNMNGAGEYNDDKQGRVGSSYGNAVLLQALLFSLVRECGVRPQDITIYDTCRLFPDYMISMCATGELEGVNFRQRDPYGLTDASADKNAPLRWAGKIDGEPVFLPACVTDADYLINLGNLKGHSWGMTLAAKNHFGSFVNSDRRNTPQTAGLHSNIINAEMGDYSCLVDLMAHKDLGGKTVLWLLDGLISAPSESARLAPANTKWKMQPFDNNYTASLFLSQDPVAIDSVGADFIVNEPVMLCNNRGLATNHGMENYLHEAALLPNPPSGAKYMDGAGKNPGSLGVHEHWNNPVDKLYSRNRGLAEGIELVRWQAKM